jgi:hypothetical protein
MARSLSIDPEKYNLNTQEGMTRLWSEITQAIGQGIPRTAETIMDDPFAVFVTGICQRPHGRNGEWHEQTVISKTGAMVDQKQGEDMIAYFKAQDNVNTCEACGEKITTWSCDNTRISTFAAQDKKRRASGASIVRGSD